MRSMYQQHFPSLGKEDWRSLAGRYYKEENGQLSFSFRQKTGFGGRHLDLQKTLPGYVGTISGFVQVSLIDHSRRTFRYAVPQNPGAYAHLALECQSRNGSRSRVMRPCCVTKPPCKPSRPFWRQQLTAFLVNCPFIWRK